MDRVQHKQRKRSANFTRSEVIALMHLTHKYKTEINTKFMPTNSNKVKEQAWQKIALEFNSFPQNQGNPRTAHILRNKFSNLKKQQKRKLAQMDKDRTVSDDETIAFDDETSAENCDSDDHEIRGLKQEICEEDLKGSEADSAEKGEEPYFSLEKKDDLLELQKRCLLEEHAVKMQQMQEKHNQSLQMQEREAEERLKHMREEHRLQMEILQLRKQCLLK